MVHDLRFCPSLTFNRVPFPRSLEGPRPSRRVGQGGYPPRPPTDPDVRDSRIRLVRLWIRYSDGDLVNDSGARQRVPSQKVVKA